MASSERSITGQRHMSLIICNCYLKFWEQQRWLKKYEVSISFNKNSEIFTPNYKIFDNTCVIDKTRFEINYETQSFCKFVPSSLCGTNEIDIKRK